MKRMLRILLAAIGILGLVMVGAVVFVTTFLDPEDLKPRLVEIVREQTGLELELGGQLNWSFYPRLGVSVNTAEAWLPGRSEGQAPFAAFEYGEVSLSFAPLLRREIAIDGLTIVGLDLNLERDAQGRGNWEALLERLDNQRQSVKSVLVPASAGVNPSSPDLAVNVNIASVQLQDGRVRYADVQTGNAYQLSNLVLAGTNVSPGKAFPLKGSVVVDYFETLDAESSSLNSQLDLSTNVTLGLTERRHLLEGFSLKASSHFGSERSRQEFQLMAEQLELDLGADSLRLTNSQLQAGLLYPLLGEKRLAFDMQFDLEGHLDTHTANLRQIALTGPDGLNVTGNLLFEALNTAPRYSGQLKLAPFSLKKWLARFDAMPAMNNPDALSDVGLTSPVEGDLMSLTLDGLNMTLDSSTLSGRLSAAFDGTQLDASLQGDSIHLDDYLVLNEEGAEVAQLAGITRAWAQQEHVDLLPAEWLAEVALNLQLRLDELVVAKQRLQDVTLNVDGDDGVHQLTQFSSNLHSGTLQATGTLNASDAPLQWALSFEGDELRLASLLASLGHEPPPAEGLLYGQGELTSQGNSVERVTRGLNGQVELGINEGRLTGANISRELCGVAARLEGKPLGSEWPEGTPFEQATATIDITDGIASTDDLVLNIPGINVGANGTLDLGSEAFDLRVAASFSDDVDPACAVNPRLIGVALPLRCKGQLSEDSSKWCRLDSTAVQAALSQALQREIQRRFGNGAEKALDEPLGEEAASGLRKAIKGLLE
ncbi:AsmA family protein [Halomonas halocynthiae]|uniref:AsmA family protein n=1 Tax=Halomonas halocynthiae TaxID=176290 RepID=UPI0004195259|nr:AsmA family protein [Halomonas halocynthiae]